MIGDVRKLNEFRPSDAWSKLLIEMGVEKFGLYRRVGKEPTFKFLSDLVVSVPETLEVPILSYQYALVTHLGFKFEPLGLMFRNIKEKDFKVTPFGKTKFMFYATEAFENNEKVFKPGAPLVVLEGSLDAEAFVHMTGYPFVIACLTANIGPSLTAFIASMTDKVLVVPDSDDAGTRGLEMSKRNLRSLGVRVKSFRTVEKDFAEVLRKRNTAEAEKAKVLLCAF